MNEPYKIARQRLYLGRGCLVSVSVSGQWEGCTSAVCVLCVSLCGESDVGRARALRDRVCNLVRQQGLPCEIFEDETCHDCALTHHAVDLTRRHVSSGGGVEGVAAPRRCESGRFATMHTRRAVHSDRAGERSRKRSERRAARLAPLRQTGEAYS